MRITDVKKIAMIRRFIYTLLLLLPAVAGAQHFYNFTGINDKGLLGTARFVGMGGSMSALGADISVMGVNPAGIALYRSNDCAFTASFENNESRSSYNNTEMNSSYSGCRLDNFGVVISNRLGASDIEFINIGIAYRANNTLNRNFDMYGAAKGFSQQYVIDELYRKNPFDTDNVTYSMYEKLGYNWLTLLASDGRLVADDGNLITGADGELLYPPTHHGYYSEERGGVDVADVNASLNIMDRVYLGVTFSYSLVDYDRYSYYNEDDAIGEIYSIVNNYSVSGTGVDFKLGAIVRPFKYLPLKVGVAFHTPTYYRLHDTSYASIAGVDGLVYDTRDEQRYYDTFDIKYKYRTPWRVNASVAYTLGSYLALNAEYEFTDYRNASYAGRTTLCKMQNYDIDACLRGQHIARVGAELNLNRLALRAGYSYSTAMFNASAYKLVDNMSVTDTATEYLNLYDKSNVTFGLGYRFDSLYIDLAYMLQMQQGDFYPFYDTEYVNPAAKAHFTDQTVALTMGMRF